MSNHKKGNSKPVENPDFGCAACWPSDAEGVWAARARAKLEADLLDDSHFHVMVLRCEACSQRFLSVFMESIDWPDGDDPQYWSYMPITPEEHVKLAALPAISDRVLGEIGGGRKCLFRAFPKGGEIYCRWVTGLMLVPHD